MAKSVKAIVSNLNDLMRKNGNEAITLNWKQFYIITKRERMHETIMTQITKELKKYDYHIFFGNYVIVVRDCCWKPIGD
ncbi:MULTISPECIES: hypothetical protein [unclassified Gilliamella]|uniref:hypothetical protein n=1 Tax=unclassified Gilliamella TaxID=2685620 RepID=UPI00080E204A|nr:hypothetical protein [Gilliamella apicola]MCO6547884.1 hypothetical protein [Gilliamella sp.]MCO6555149.1 hypothetical protein [Gilliamella sp.]OCG38270.1 hypothetical protein A9G32_00015 [Gilliamella apicola]OCG46640.1 hypothetical protein A9G27_06355 [Gilliamella apicola]OCG52856.1 hypothetical protein A9G26_12515 [Gilliamella apicola]